MGLYDNFKQADTPYMSQYVGSVVPEITEYAKNMQTRYNQAADTDDALTEALNNLQHLGFDADTQYANELKQKVYQRLSDRAATGDYENMGRRTKRDAMSFSAEYQPLVQRQKDFATVQQRVNADPNISDPEKKAQIMEYIKNLNSTPVDPLTGDYVRDPSGKVVLNGIQDWAYARDVDINEKLANLLSKREAEIKQGQFQSDGSGLKISTIEKLRDPAVMKRLADEMMNSDPEIKAMLNRDVTLSTYKLKPDEVAAQLKPLDTSLYQQAIRQGLSPKEIQVQAKAQGISVNDLKQSALKTQQAQYMKAGMSLEAANRAILNNQMFEKLKAPHTGFVGSLLGYKQTTLEAREDVAYNDALRSAAAKALKDPNFDYTTNTIANISTGDPLSDVHAYGASSTGYKEAGKSLQGSILASLKLAGMSTGDPKKDMAISSSIMHNKEQLNALRDKLRSTNPELAQQLETRHNQYQDNADAIQVQRSRVDDIERSAGIDINKLYQQYRTGKLPGAAIDHIDKNPLSKEDFIDAIRNPDSPNTGFFHNVWNNNRGLMKATKAYNEAIKTAAKDKHVSENYHTLEPTGEGKVHQLTELIEGMANTGNLRVTDLHDPSKGSQSVYSMYGIDPSKNDKDTRLAEKGIAIRWNAEGVNGKPTLSILNKVDGTSRIVRADNLPPHIADELAIEGIKKARTANTSDYAKVVGQQSLISLGSAEMTNMTAQYLKTLEPSSVIKPINSQFGVKIKPKGDGSNRYQLHVKDENGNYKAMATQFDSVDDLVKDLGTLRAKRIAAAGIVE